MKRSSVIALILGAIVSAIVIALHATGVTLPLEQLAMTLLAHGGEETTKVVSVKVQYALVIVLSLGVVWLVLKSSRRRQLDWPVAILALELIVATWVCALYHVFFQPLPSLLALGLSLVTGHGYAAFGGRVNFGSVRELFAGRVSEKTVEVLPPGDFASEAKSYEATAVVCDIANKHDLAEERSPAEYAAIVEKFIREMSDSFTEAGAYIESAGGEGIVAIFGFPKEDPTQAEKATLHALKLVDSAGKDGRNGSSGDVEVHLGISTGTIIAAPIQRNGRPEILTSGEPVELARRFCIANRFYGSRVLVGPQTFEFTSKTILARPIDFLSGVDARDRHEIYEPLSLAAEATAEQIARRDSFWSGVVLYREKRWAEAYAQFQSARGPEGDGDAPLQLYLRRIEPLALHLAMSQDD